jgi:hypothetical protein
MENPKKARIGNLIQNTRLNLKNTIKALVQECFSVLMGEAIGLSLASAVVEKLGWTHATFLTDSRQILAKYMNGDNQAPPHDWSRIKPFVYNFFT